MAFRMSMRWGIEQDEEAWVVRKERFIRDCKWRSCDLVEEWIYRRRISICPWDCDDEGCT